MQQVLPIIILLVFIIYVLLILYYLWGWKSIPIYQPKVQTPCLQTKISIIIPVRNEAENIKACLDAILNQSYPKHLFEVLVVDDFSTDNTAGFVSAYAVQNIKLISLKNFVEANKINSYKKKAIEIAIQHSTGDLIVTTDADCIAPVNWLQTIAAFYEHTNASLIVMPVAINCGNRFIEIFQAVDFMTLQGITGASVNKKIHSMCNGANLAYTKTAFTEVGGFKGIDSIASGDDMLLMHKIYKHHPDKVLFLKSKDIIVQTNPVHTIKEFFNQRIRWASKADKYDDKRIIAVLLLVYVFNVLLLAMPIVALFKNFIFNIHIYPITFIASVFELWLILIVSKTIVELFFLFSVARFFNKQKLLWWFPVMQLIHIIYTVIAGWLGKFGSYKWKGRNVK